MRSHVVHFLAQYLRPDVAELVAPTWFTCIGIAGLVALVLVYAIGRRRGIDGGIDGGTLGSVLVWSYTSAVIAGIAMPMLIDTIERLASTGHLQLRWSGMTSFWGYLAGLGAAVLVCRRDGVPVARFADVAVIPLGFALVIARIGCFMAGCDYGKVTTVPWAMRFPAGSPAWHDHVRSGLIPATRGESLPVHPTELYEALIGVAIIVIGVALARRLRAREGRLFLVGAATYALARLIVVEPLRGDAGRGIYLGLSSGQIFSLLVLAAIAARTFVTSRRRILATAIAAGAFLVCIGDADDAFADEPAHLPLPPAPDSLPPPPIVDGETPPKPPSATQIQAADLPIDESEDTSDTIMPDASTTPYRPVMRPHFRIAAALGIAAPLDRPSATVPTMVGQSLSFGYTPGWFGVWLDLDHYTNSEAAHTSYIASVGYARRITPRFTLGARAGLGLTRITFDSPTFADISARTARIDVTAEVAMSRDWGLWIRPLTIDTTSADALGGALTTYRFGIGVDYRFGFHQTRPRQPVAPPPAAAALPPVVAGTP